MSARPDLVACWLFRLDPAEQPEILLIRRAEGGSYAGLWQCVTGSLEADERIVDGARREVIEETGLGPSDLEAIFETEIVNWFHEATRDALMCEAVFAARVRAGAAIRLSDEHEEARWLAPEDARTLVVWPAYLRAIDFIEWLLANPDRAETFRLRTDA
ncbi:MAG: dATP pyrophosphohydrolase [Chloroflexi bacterium]|nr:dATP pyrophosphohydrolase [Chloroflexota bacterium]